MRYVLLDLDGTLIDPARGIIGACQSALQGLGEPLIHEEELRWIIGPPLRTTFAKLLRGDDRVEQALSLYRASYTAKGIFEAEPYDGVRQALSTLRADGYRLLICTSKPEPFARKVLDHFELRSLVDEVYGAELGGRLDDKGDLIQHILDIERFPAGDATMVGDRMHDINGAKRHGMQSVGVLWGYGSREELVNAGASVLCAHPLDLRDRIRNLV